MRYAAPVLILFATGCATPDPRITDRMRQLLLDAAHECSLRYPSVYVDRVDQFGQLHFTYRQGGTDESEQFLACTDKTYRMKMESG